MNTVELTKHFAASFSCSVLMIGSKLVISNRENNRVLVPGFKEMTEESARIQLKNAVKTLKLNKVISAPTLVVDNKEPVVNEDYEEPAYEEMFG